MGSAVPVATVAPPLEATLHDRRVLFVVGGLEHNGALGQALLLADYLHLHHQARVELWGLRGPGPPPHPWLDVNFACRYRRFRWTRKPLRRWRRISQFALWLRRARPDAILAYNVVPAVVCGLTWRLSGARTFIWSQRDEIVNVSSPAWARLAASRTPQFVSNSEHAAAALHHELGIATGRIEVVRNGVRLEPAVEPPSEWRRRLGAGPDDLVACMVANVQSRKDHPTLLRAWRIVAQRMREHGRRAILAIAGRMDDAAVLELARGLGADDVRFLGFVSDVPGLLASSDLGVFSSSLEGCPNGVLECMHAGLAVVASDIPGNREALGPGGWRWLVPGGDERAFAHRVLELVSNSSLRDTVGAANRERVTREFSVETMGERTARLLLEGIAQDR